MSETPEIVLLTCDLVTQSRVEAAAMRCGALLRSVLDGESFMDRCVASSARLAIIDLTVTSVDLSAVVTELKSGQASWPIVIAFGPHVHEARLAAAAQAGCDEVMSRGQFFAQLDSILARFVAPRS